MRIIVDKVPQKCKDCICTKQVRERFYDDYMDMTHCVYLDKRIPYSDSFGEDRDKLEKCPLVSFDEMFKEKMEEYKEEEEYNKEYGV